MERRFVRERVGAMRECVCVCVCVYVCMYVCVWGGVCTGVWVRALTFTCQDEVRESLHYIQDDITHSQNTAVDRIDCS